MPSAIPHKRWDKTITIAVLFVVGIALVFIRLLLLLFPLTILWEGLLFFGFGYLFGNKVYKRRWTWGLLLALPVILIALYFLIKGQDLRSAAGTRHIASLLVVPSAACLGIYLRIKRRHKIDLVDNRLLE